MERFLQQQVWKHPTIEQVFVEGYADDPAGFRNWSQALPGVRVWHLDVNGGRIASMVFLLLATLTLGGAVLQQVQATFAMPQARMYPRFARPHLIVPLAICGGGIAAATFVAGKFGADYWATAALQVFGWGAWAAFEFLAPLFARDRSEAPREREGRVLGAITGARIGWIGPIVFIALIAFFGFTFIGHPYVLESFLLGELPALTASFFVVGVGLGVAAVKWAPELAVSLNEAGVMPVLSMQDVESRRRAPILSAPPTNRRLASLRRPHRITWLWRTRAMRLGNPDLLIPFAIKIALPALLVAAGASIANLGYLSKMFGLILVLAGWLLSLSGCFANWWQRRKAFSVELLYPWSRRQLTLAAFAAYALDAAGVLALLLVSVITCNLTLRWQLGRHVMATGALVVVAATLLMAVGGLWLLTLRHRLLASFLAFGGMVLMYCAFILAARTLGNGVHPGFVALAYAWFVTLLGIATYQRWMRSEWGRFGS
jgi:hypothetical protein